VPLHGSISQEVLQTKSFTDLPLKHTNPRFAIFHSQVQGKIVLAGFSALDFGLAGTAWAELELLGDEIHMRNGSLYVYGAMKCTANQLLMDNSTIQIIGGSSILTKTTVVDVNHLELKVSDTPYAAHGVLST
jgi:hypothetical protein